jgi:hypothetical protein
LAATVKARDLNRLAGKIRNTDYSINGSCQHKHRKDVERILAEDSDYEGLQDLLAELDGTGPS